jgi:2'-5' RNA ligase
MQISCLGAFPKKEYPRVVWVGLSEGEEETKQIAEELENEICRLGIAKEKRPFSSHITLGRVRSAHNRSQLTERLNYLEQNFPQGWPACKVDRITLFKSTLTPSGPIYEVLHEKSLKTT